MTTRCLHQSIGWLDRAAILMAIVCGIHCLVTPILLVALPIAGVTFLASEDFHFWMLVLVIPTTTLAVFSGCRKHKDRLVAIFAAAGLFVLASVVAMESFAAGPVDFLGASGAEFYTADGHESAPCASCCSVAAAPEEGFTVALASYNLSAEALLNLLGGLFLIAGHTRNFHLCRAARCCDGQDGLSTRRRRGDEIHQ